MGVAEMKYALSMAFIALVVAFTVWLFLDKNAARPGPLIAPHRAVADCQDCHVPWKGVGDDLCLNCHGFGNVDDLRPELRFHQAERYCTVCHKEHRGMNGSISRMDHTILHPDLTCDRCHLDPHDALFGANCRECHELKTWRIAGYHHPPREDQNCSRCHAVPLSHQGKHFEELILKFHLEKTLEKTAVEPNQCWRCHVVHDWRHRLM
jgi:hypothetical protein